MPSASFLMVFAPAAPAIPSPVNLYTHEKPIVMHKVHYVKHSTAKGAVGIAPFQRIDSIYPCRGAQLPSG